MSEPVQVPISALLDDKQVWPRDELDTERVGLFADIYGASGPEGLPPITLVPTASGRYLIADGWTRAHAAMLLKWESVPAVIEETPTGVDVIAFAYELALRMATTSAKPLTRAERQRAIARLLDLDPSRSDRDIAALVGVAHTTVGRLRNRLDGDKPAKPTQQAEPGESYLGRLSAEDAARGLFRGLQELEEARGLGDLLFGDQTAQRLARIFQEVFGENAADRAKTYGGWLDGALRLLTARAS